jgi:acyl carrier protein
MYILLLLALFLHNHNKYLNRYGNNSPNRTLNPGVLMVRENIVNQILDILKDEFEITNPGLDDNLKEKFEFDSIDAIVLLEYMEKMIGSELTQEEKKLMLDIRTINQICDYIEEMMKRRK